MILQNGQSFGWYCNFPLIYIRLLVLSTFLWASKPDPKLYWYRNLYTPSVVSPGEIHVRHSKLLLKYFKRTSAWHQLLIVLIVFFWCHLMKKHKHCIPDHGSCPSASSAVSCLWCWGGVTRNDSSGSSGLLRLQVLRNCSSKSCQVCGIGESLEFLYHMTMVLSWATFSCSWGQSNCLIAITLVRICWYSPSRFSCCWLFSLLAGAHV